MARRLFLYYEVASNGKPLGSLFGACALWFFSSAHFTARLGALTTSVSTSLHDFASNNRFTRNCTGFTNICAESTNCAVHGRTTQHEVCGCLTNLDTICHQLDVILFNVLAALFKAVLIKRGFTLISALIAGFNTVFHVFVHIFHVVH